MDFIDRGGRDVRGRGGGSPILSILSRGSRPLFLLFDLWPALMPKDGDVWADGFFLRVNSCFCSTSSSFCLVGRAGSAPK